MFFCTLEQGQLSQTELTSLKNENDHGVIQLEGRWEEGGSTSDAIFAGKASVNKTVDDIAVSAAGGWVGAARGGVYGASIGAATGTPHGTAIGGAIGTVGGGVVGGYDAGAAYDDSPIDEALDAAVDAKFDRIAENFNAGYDEGKAE